MAELIVLCLWEGGISSLSAVAVTEDSSPTLPLCWQCTAIYHYNCCHISTHWILCPRSLYFKVPLRDGLPDQMFPKCWHWHKGGFCPTRWSLWYWYLDFYVDHLVGGFQMNSKADQNPYGSESPGRGKWSKCGIFLVFLKLCCDQTVWFFNFS